MALKLEIKRSLNFKHVYEIFKFELFLQRKRYIILSVLSLIIYNFTAVILIIMLPSNPLAFVASAVGQFASFLMFLTLFFAGGIFADEFDKRTALTNFTKTGRDNFFVGKTLAAFTSVLAWIGPITLESIILTLVLYQQVPIELFLWFGFYCLAGATYTAIYLLHSAIFRSGGQAMMMSFITFICLATAFGLFLAFLNAPYYFPIYAEIVGQMILSGGSSDTEGFAINMGIAIFMLLCYLIPCLLIAYLRFKTRDV